MDHPIINSRRNIFIYYLVCIFMAGIYALFLYNFYNATLWQSLSESVVYTSVFSILGLGLWFVVRFSNIENVNFFNLAVNHLAIAVVTLILWLIIGYYSLNVLTFLFDDYNKFFNSLILWRVMMGITWYIMVVLVYYVIYYYRNFHERVLLQSALQSDIKTAEMQVLKARINPHFLFNSLNSINALTIEAPEKAREMIVKLSDYLRNTISGQQEGMKTFEEELINVNNYLDIEKVRFGDRLTVTEDISEGCKKDKVPGMIIQPLIENAIKYGVEENTGNVAIKIVADCFQGYLKVQIENRFNPEFKKPGGTGTGLSYIKKRVQLIYNRDDLVQVSANGRVFRVTLNFPQKIL
jgi:sensor histidine kinase YesM